MLEKNIHQKSILGVVLAAVFLVPLCCAMVQPATPVITFGVSTVNPSTVRTRPAHQ